MARSTRRKGRREAEDEDDGEDDFAWQPKKKSKKGTGRSERPGRSSSTKKKSSKSKSSRSKSSEGARGKSSEGARGRSSDSTRSKKKGGGSSSSTRKSGSARRKRPSGDDDDVGNSGRRRRAPAKKKGVEPIVPISIVTATILICIGLYFFLNKPQPVVVNEEDDWSAAKKLQEEGMEAYGAFVRSRAKDQPDISKHKREEAILKLRSAVEAMNLVLDPKRDDEGYLPKEFEGYENDLSQIAKYLIDLEKM